MALGTLPLHLEKELAGQIDQRRLPAPPSAPQDQEVEEQLALAGMYLAMDENHPCRELPSQHGHKV